MIFNLVSNLNENYDVTKFNAYNHTVTFSLMIALIKKGHEVNLIQDTSDKLRNADHTIVISNFAINRIRKEPDYLKALRDVTSGKLCLWLDSDMGNWPMFDIVFCVNYTGRELRQFTPVGWGVDPEVFFPEQQEKAVFVDSYMTGWYNGQHDHVYTKIENALKTLNIKVFQPVKQYNKGRVTWTELINIFKRCSFYVLTQKAYWGITNLEAASCGCLLVVHKSLDCPNTWPSELNHVFWETENDLKQILSSTVEVFRNREIATKNSWETVVNKILETL